MYSGLDFWQAGLISGRLVSIAGRPSLAFPQPVPRENLSNYLVNKVLDIHPTEVNSKENYLPRKVRYQLSQLRSGYSKLLNS